MRPPMSTVISFCRRDFPQSRGPAMARACPGRRSPARRLSSANLSQPNRYNGLVKVFVGQQADHQVLERFP